MPFEKIYQLNLLLEARQKFVSLFFELFVFRNEFILHFDFFLFSGLEVVLITVQNFELFILLLHFSDFEFLFLNLGVKVLYSLL